MLMDVIKSIWLGNAIKPFTEYVFRADWLVFILFPYACVCLYGSNCAKVVLKKVFNEFVLLKAEEILQKEPGLKMKALSKKVYEEWEAYVKSEDFPKKYKIPIAKGWWIGKPTIEALRDDYHYDEDKIIAILTANE